MMYSKVLLIISLLFFQYAGMSSQVDGKDLVKTSVNLFSTNNKNYLAISFINKEKWHTYWKNPGSAGKPIEVKIENIETQELEWPTPKLYRENGGLIAYGYSDQYTRFFEITSSNLNSEVIIKINWLICKEICIPGNKNLKYQLSANNLTGKNDFYVSTTELAQEFSKIPTSAPWPADLEINFNKGNKENTLVLTYKKTSPYSSTKNHNLLTPFPVPLITFNNEIINKTENLITGQLPLEWDGEYEEPPLLLPANGQLSTPINFKFIYLNPITKKAEVLSKEFSSFSLTPALEITQKSEPSTIKTSEKNQENTALWLTFIFAFLGGLILNIMPCVLPVISLKLFSLASHSDESNKMILKHNLFYTLGVLISFLVLGLIIIALKASGESIGWGFQLQSPVFVFTMIIFLFILGLNLFGLFEFTTPGGKSLGNYELKKGVLGDFMGGVLATILSTPCSAPILGTALTVAFTSTALISLSLFLMIGLGLATPFIITGLFPGTIRFLPKPGMWMEHVKKFLGITMLLTVIWLLDVFTSLVDSPLAMANAQLILLLLFFAFYFQKNISKNTVYKIIVFLIPLTLTLSLFRSIVFSSSNSHQSANSMEKSVGLNWEKWSEEKMKSYAQEEQLLFIDFTAKWCLTCKVNEKLVLETSGFKKLIKDYNIKLLLADWTKRDPVIEKFLKAHGHAGVPAYFIQKRDGTLIDLGETISLEEIEANLK